MKKLFWLDMEMSGLDINKEVIIEVAAIITDLNFKELDTFEAIVKQPQHFLLRLSLKCRSPHAVRAS